MHQDNLFLSRAYVLALEAEKQGNLPVGALVVHGDEIVAEGLNQVLAPVFNPLAHAEINALNALPNELFTIPEELTVYTTMEPCVMCTSTIVVAHFGRVVFGATDHGLGGQTLIQGAFQEMYAHRQLPEWVGPVDQDKFYPLASRSRAVYSQRPNSSRRSMDMG